MHYLDFCAQTLRRKGRYWGVGYVPGRGGSELTETTVLSVVALMSQHPHPQKIWSESTEVKTSRELHRYVGTIAIIV